MESLGEKVLFLLNKSKEHSCTDDEYNKIVSYIDETSDNLVLGKIFGDSVSDYAIASLKWIGTEKTLLKYQEIYSN